MSACSASTLAKLAARRLASASSSFLCAICDALKPDAVGLDLTLLASALGLFSALACCFISFASSANAFFSSSAARRASSSACFSASTAALIAAASRSAKSASCLTLSASSSANFRIASSF